ncbi:ATPase, T2SS/T4P/T4SS family [Salinirubrum litoreum]|uniref:ATPase, T2SS/T4P/T4SS family n=1 Tax=Salinirubrum litoreum TaxID=1126234 RepID=A0ABD5R8M3_9EURY|nr:ATPase, T2SS/T4P/T4SS family [Salinirubrum litoreum]
MAIDDADGSDPSQLSGADDSAESEGHADGEAGTDTHGQQVTVGEYTWSDYLTEYDYDEVESELYRNLGAAPGSERWDSGDDEAVRTTLGEQDWARVDFDPEEHLGFHPTDTEDRVGEAGATAERLQEHFESFCDPETTPVVKDEYLWEHYKREYYYDEDGSRPESEGEVDPFDAEPTLGFDPEHVESVLSHAGNRRDDLAEIVDRRTVDVAEDFSEDDFFSTSEGHTTVVNRYDLEKSVPLAKKTHFEEIERYWVNKPYAFVIIFHSSKENEKKYYVVQPYTTEIESDLKEFLTGKLRNAIKYSDDGVLVGGDDQRRTVIENETLSLLERYDLYQTDDGNELLDTVAERLGVEDDEGTTAKLLAMLGWQGHRTEDGGLEGIEARPEPVVIEEDRDTLSEYQVDKLLYLLKRDFIGYERIDGIKNDVNVEDISCDGYNSPVFVYHGDYEQLITNIYHDETELDDFVVKLAQRSGKGISKRRPQVDATLPDGSRAQLTLGKEVSDHGTNYTIRQFKDVPFTPIDLINWSTFSLDEMAFLWLCIENNKSLIFAGGTASGKTTSLNAVSLFIPSNAKIVSIEDTREVELPQRNWIASVTRPSFSDDDKGDVDEFDLLEAALRQRPEYIVMGEIRGEEGRTLFQVMSTGHTTYTTFHADSVGEVLKRFTTDPINVSKTMFTALDLVSIQTQTRVQGNKVRRNKSLTEINHYDAENDEINVQDVYQWQAETDEFLKMGDSNTLDEIKFDRGWNEHTLRTEMFKRRVVLAYLIKHGLNTYTQVAATFQAFINDQDTILTLMANGQLERSLEDLREMESVLIDIDPEKEAMVPRPSANEEKIAEAEEILDRAEDELFDDYRGEDASSVASALLDLESEEDVVADADDDGPDHPELAAADHEQSDDGPDPLDEYGDEFDDPSELEAPDESDDPDELHLNEGQGGGSMNLDDPASGSQTEPEADAEGDEDVLDFGDEPMFIGSDPSEMDDDASPADMEDPDNWDVDDLGDPSDFDEGGGFDGGSDFGDGSDFGEGSDFDGDDAPDEFDLGGDEGDDADGDGDGDAGLDDEWGFGEFESADPEEDE